MALPGETALGYRVVLPCTVFTHTHTRSHTHTHSHTHTSLNRAQAWGDVCVEDLGVGGDVEVAAILDGGLVISILLSY